MQTFVHLRVHTEFSLLSGMAKIKDLLQQAQLYQMPAIAITDIANFFGLIKFYNGALQAGIKPIFGADLWLENDEDPSAPFLVTLLAADERGYRNLIELLSQAYLENQQQGRAITQTAWLEQRHEGLIMLSGARSGDVGQAILRGKTALAEQRARRWQQLFADRYYLELQRTGRQQDELIVTESLSLARKWALPVVATNDVMFLQQDDFGAHETRVCINEGVVLEDPKRAHLYSEQQFLKSMAEMTELFADIPQAIENSVAIARRCSAQIPLGKYFLPDYPVPGGGDIDGYLRKLAHEGLSARLQQLPAATDDESRQPYLARLEAELSIIIQMGYPGYFLVVMDFIRWAKANGVPVGPGRGSGAGSLVAWSLNITDLDPLQYDLLFERFLNPERLSMPDFDVDFCMEGRERVIQYVADTYGREAVSQIVTFGTMAAKAVVRDVARVQGKSFGLADRLSKLIPPDPGMKLQQALEEVAELRDVLAHDDEAAEIWDMALKLEGVTRQTGKHAGGVVIAPTALTDFAPLICEPDGAGLITQYDKDDVEAAGLVKFDFLGLRTLTTIDWALAIINPRRVARGEPAIDISHIPLDDEACFKQLKQAQTTAIFQLESRGMKDLVARLKPDNLEDMIALVALFRPGPLQSGMVDNFINRKHGKEDIAYPDPRYQHESLRPILAPTYGIILYQEQVLQVAQVLAGYSLGGADLLRRAMGKKKPEEMAKQRAVFQQGAIAKGVDGELAMKIFDLVEKFSGYGFVKSHSAAYALVSYQTLWLKTHYPAAFMAATLSSELQNTDKVVIFIEECLRLGLKLLPPDVNRSHYLFTVDEQEQIIYGLGAIKGVGEGPVQALIAAREQDGMFTDLFDFCNRIDTSKLNKRAVEALIKAGALDTLGANRQQLLAAMPDAFKAAEQNSENRAAGMTDLFGLGTHQPTKDVYANYAGILEESVKLRLAAEKEILGFYLSGHPLDGCIEELRQFASRSLADVLDGATALQRSRRSQAVTVAGLVQSVRVRTTQRGEPMAIVTLDDKSARLECSFYGEIYSRFKDLLVPDEIILIEAEVSWDDYNDRVRVKAHTADTLSKARERAIAAIEFQVEQADAEDFLARLQPLLRSDLPAQQGSSIAICYSNTAASGELYLDEQYRIVLADETLHQLKTAFPKHRVCFRYRLTQTS